MHSASRRSQKTYGRQRNRPRFSVFQDPVADAIWDFEPDPDEKLYGKGATSLALVEEREPIKASLAAKGVGGITNDIDVLGSNNDFSPPNQPKKAGKANQKLSQDANFITSNFLPGNVDRSSKRLTMKLQEKSTNTDVTRRCSVLKTPVMPPMKVQKPKSPPPKKPLADTPQTVLNTSPLAHRAHQAPLIAAEPPLDDQNFLSGLATSKSKSQKNRFNFSHYTEFSKPSNEPPKNSGIQEHLAATRAANPGNRLFEKAKEVVNDTTRAAVNFLPILGRSKSKNAKLPKEANVNHRIRGIAVGLGKEIKRQTSKYDKIVNGDDSSDIAEKIPIPNTKAKGLLFITSQLSESCQNLLDGPTSDSSKEVKAFSTKTSRTRFPNINRSDEEMPDASLDSEDQIISTTPPKSLNKAKRAKKQRQSSCIVEDPDQGFEGDAEMLTGEDDFDPQDEGPDISGDIPKAEGSKPSITYDWGIFEIPDPFQDQTSTVTGGSSLENYNKTHKGEIDQHTGRRIKNSGIIVHKESTVHGVISKKRSHDACPCESPPADSHHKRRPVRSQLGQTRVQSPSSVKKDKRIPIIDNPPVDSNMLSEDELCSQEYLVLSSAPSSGKKGNASTHSGNRNKSVRSRGHLVDSSPVPGGTLDLMDIDELQWSASEYRV